MDAWQWYRTNTPVSGEFQVLCTTGSYDTKMYSAEKCCRPTRII